MPTEEVLTDNSNASAPDESHQEKPEITDDLIKSHPLYQDLEKKHSAARKGLDDKAKEVKRLKQAIVDDEPEAQEEKVEEAKGFTQDEKDLLKWEIKNQDKIDLASEEFEKYRSKGYQPEDALRLALDDKGISKTNLPEHLRQISSGVPGATVNRESVSDVTDKEREWMKEYGYSEETLKAHKKLKAERQKVA